MFGQHLEISLQGLSGLSQPTRMLTRISLVGIIASIGHEHQIRPPGVAGPSRSSVSWRHHYYCHPRVQRDLRGTAAVLPVRDGGQKSLEAQASAEHGQFEGFDKCLARRDLAQIRDLPQSRIEIIAVIDLSSIFEQSYGC
jgi:hypothetical protein